MHAALRPYVTAGIALVGASMIAVTPVTPSLPGLHCRATGHASARLLNREYSGEPGSSPWPISRTTSRWPYKNMRTPSGRPARPEGCRDGFPRGPPWHNGGARRARTEPLTISTPSAGPAVGGRNPPTATPGVGTTATGRSWPRLAQAIFPFRARPAHRPTIADFRAGRVHCWRARQLRVRVCRRAGLPGRLAHVPNAAYSAACRNDLPRHR